MKKLLLIALIACGLQASAQTFETKTDPFNNKKIKNASAKIGGMIAPFAKMTIGFNFTGDQQYILFTVRSGSAIIGDLTDKTKNVSLLFKLENDSVFRFKCDTIFARPDNSESNSILVLRAPITKLSVLSFASFPIKNFRIGVKDDNGVDLDDSRILTTGNKNDVQKAAAYMLDMQFIADKPADQ